jgi:hypothetical protein
MRGELGLGLGCLKWSVRVALCMTLFPWEISI